MCFHSWPILLNGRCQLGMVFLVKGGKPCGRQQLLCLLKQYDLHRSSQCLLLAMQQVDPHAVNLTHIKNRIRSCANASPVHLFAYRRA